MHSFLPLHAPKTSPKQPRGAVLFPTFPQLKTLFKMQSLSRVELVAQQCGQDVGVILNCPNQPIVPFFFGVH